MSLKLRPSSPSTSLRRSSSATVRISSSFSVFSAAVLFLRFSRFLDGAVAVVDVVVVVDVGAVAVDGDVGATNDDSCSSWTLSGFFFFDDFFLM